MREPVRLDRFVLSRAEGPVLAHLFGSLFPPHGRRERWLRLLAARSGGVARAAFGATSGERDLGEATRVLERLRSATPVGAEAAAGDGDWLLAGPGPEDPRGRLTAFLFPPHPRAGGGAPDRVVKLRREGGSGPGLAAEGAALDRLRQELPEPLRGTLPAVLGGGWLGDEGERGWEFLVLTALPGRSAYVELQRALLLRSRLPARHLALAGSWLARFHRATFVRGNPWRPPPWEALAPPGAGSPPDWYRRLVAALDESPWPRAAGHGDFWARNVLLRAGWRAGGRPGEAAGLAGVVDWEHFRSSAPPFEDLFHFAWTYGRSYPWRGRRRGPEEAFGRTFLGENPVSREVRRYLAGYARESGLDAGALGDLFRVYLLTRTGPDSPRPALDRDGGPAASRNEDRGPWIDLYRMLEAADASVFSG